MFVIFASKHCLKLKDNYTLAFILNYCILSSNCSKILQVLDLREISDKINRLDHYGSVEQNWEWNMYTVY